MGGSESVKKKEKDVLLCIGLECMVTVVMVLLLFWWKQGNKGWSGALYGKEWCDTSYVFGIVTGTGILCHMILNRLINLYRNLALYVGVPAYMGIIYLMIALLVEQEITQLTLQLYLLKGIAISIWGGMFNLLSQGLLRWYDQWVKKMDLWIDARWPDE